MRAWFEHPLLAPLRAMAQPGSEPVWTGELYNMKLALHPAQFYAQGALVLLAVLYLVASLLGRWRNTRRVAPFAAVLMHAMQGEFAQVGASADAPPGLVWNGASDALLFCTGRRGVDTLHADFALARRQDPLYMVGSLLFDVFAMPTVPTALGDRLTLVLTLPAAEKRDGGVFAVVHKSALQRVHSARYDMRFARVADGEGVSAARGLNEQLAFASEAGDLTDRWLGEIGARGDAQRRRTGLVDALNASALPWFESLLWTDQPASRSDAESGVPSGCVERIELTLRLPTSRADAEACMPLVTAVLDMADALHLSATGRDRCMRLRPETVASLRRTRDEVDAAMREALGREEKDEQELARDAERRRAQKEKFDMLSPAEQARRKEVERKRALRKQQGQGSKMRRR
ncbi:hypothetical protein MVES1_003460 [Malassezia vespertilionis]|uniref:DUF1682 domain-containing protein n=1 Tax=Malassezia vespertilionis TaxID=2020962 RepID=A0A2N1J7E3_9BASI|nr:uncharacterized protein MVES1_003460 [Malassezia vespertilionis]PKI82475.1 hypothetical protein MVES_003699 [Malassezia vespertilionis]WFD08091.1 hypothetical protein MVES1_003460 [Malassezia vespertilionis]